MGDAPADPIGAPEEVTRQPEVTAGQGLADAGTAHPLTAVGDGDEVIHREAILVPHGLQQGEVPLAVMAEAEVVPHQDVPRRQAVHQEFADKGARPHGGHPRTELQQDDLIDAAVMQGMELLAQPGETRRGPLRGKELHGLGLEGDDRGRQPSGTPQIRQALEHGAVPKVDAIEGADGGHAPRRPWPQVVQSPDDPHRPDPCALKGPDYTLGIRSRGRTPRASKLTP